LIPSSSNSGSASPTPLTSARDRIEQASAHVSNSSVSTQEGQNAANFSSDAGPSSSAGRAVKSPSRNYSSPLKADSSQRPSAPKKTPRGRKAMRPMEVLKSPR
jgi:hypothetical protein